MSAIAECAIVPRVWLPEIRSSALPKKPLIGKPRDTFLDVVRSRSVSHVGYRWNGYVIATVLPFLNENGADLMHSNESGSAAHLSQARHAAFFILTDEHRPLLPILDPGRYDRAALQGYYETFNGERAEGIGEAMLDGITMLRDSVASVDEETVGILSFG